VAGRGALGLIAPEGVRLGTPVVIRGRVDRGDGIAVSYRESPGDRPTLSARFADMRFRGTGVVRSARLPGGRLSIRLEAGREIYRARVHGDALTGRGAPAATAAPGALPATDTRWTVNAGHVSTTECFAALPDRNTPADAFRAMWRSSRAGWTGGDGVLSQQLPDGRTVWLFGDTLLRGAAMVRNSMVVQGGPCLTTVRGGTPSVNGDFAETGRAGQWYWPAGVVLAGDELQVLLGRFDQVAPGMWGFRYLGTALARFALPDLRLLGIDDLAAGALASWGSGIVRDGTYTYIYGNEDSTGPKRARLARVAGTHLDGPWEFFTGSRWSSDPASSVPVVSGLSSTFSVLRTTSGYLLLSQEPNLGGGIQAFTASAPEGPWSTPSVVGSFGPQPAGTILYNGMAHPEWTDDRGSLLIGTSSNASSWADVLADPAIYVPQFLRIPSSALPARPLP
jgi:hypothetical protein